MLRSNRINEKSYLGTCTLRFHPSSDAVYITRRYDSSSEVSRDFGPRPAMHMIALQHVTMPRDLGVCQALSFYLTGVLYSPHRHFSHFCMVHDPNLASSIWHRSVLELSRAVFNRKFGVSALAQQHNNPVVGCYTIRLAPDCFHIGIITNGSDKDDDVLEELNTWRHLVGEVADSMAGIPPTRMPTPEQFTQPRAKSPSPSPPAHAVPLMASVEACHSSTETCFSEPTTVPQRATIQSECEDAKKQVDPPGSIRTFQPIPFCTDYNDIQLKLYWEPTAERVRPHHHISPLHVILRGPTWLESKAGPEGLLQIYRRIFATTNLSLIRPVNASFMVPGGSQVNFSYNGASCTDGWHLYRQQRKQLNDFITVHRHTFYDVVLTEEGEHTLVASVRPREAYAPFVPLLSSLLPTFRVVK